MQRERVGCGGKGCGNARKRGNGGRRTHPARRGGFGSKGFYPAGPGPMLLRRPAPAFLSGFSRRHDKAPYFTAVIAPLLPREFPPRKRRGTSLLPIRLYTLFPHAPLSLCLFKQEEKGDGQRTSVLVPNTRPKKRCPDGSSCQLVRNSQSILKSFAILPKAQSGYIVFYSIIPHVDNPVFQYASRHPSLRPFPSLAR